MARGVQRGNGIVVVFSGHDGVVIVFLGHNGVVVVFSGRDKGGTYTNKCAGITPPSKDPSS